MLAPRPVMLSSLILLCVFCLSGTALAKRGAPKSVPPIATGETEYRVAHERFAEAGKPAGLRASVEAWNVAAQKQLWKVEVFAVKFDPALETDVQEIYLNSLKLNGEALLVTDESGRAFQIDLATKKVSPVKKN